ncbi:hypothetical protein N7492_007646 [Penicillium capsulatum]|uniref:Uncharacterized protein n=1 Tax=Penicillium capsulatum TaxID=69766 RepID=A0A9W9I0A6_9EURO|nr:hypothetical protein N7492_007646 [Penicillium capsulatum]KAJ6117480.1 hypothetical protein N7512_007205 [Penicillium capsulatum]
MDIPRGKRKASVSIVASSKKQVRTFSSEGSRINVKPYVRLPRQSPPITDYQEVPENWNSEDNDLKEDDVEGNIQRCKERIEDGIMPQWWKTKLQNYEAVQTQMDKMKDLEPDGLSFDTVIRLRNLEIMRVTLAKDGDRLEQLPNIEAIMNVYREKKLDWSPGQVTYWSKGEKICDGPKQFDWSEFDEYNAEHGGYKSFWVEGLNGPGPSPMANFTANHKAFTVEPKDSQHLHLVTFSLRVPPDAADPDVPNEHSTLEFLDDTGSSVMIIYRDDLDKLEAKRGSPAPLMGNFTGIGVFGTLTLPTYKIEVTIQDDRGENMIDWVPIQVAVKEGSRVGSSYRISGPWMRHRFFVGSSPVNAGLLCVSKNKTGLVSLITAFPEDQTPNPPPEIVPAAEIPYIPPMTSGFFMPPNTGGGDEGNGSEDTPGIPSGSTPAGHAPSAPPSLGSQPRPVLPPMGNPYTGAIPGIQYVLEGGASPRQTRETREETPILRFDQFDLDPSDSTTTTTNSSRASTQDWANSVAGDLYSPRPEPLALFDYSRALSPVQGLLLPQPAGGRLFPPPPLPAVPRQRDPEEASEEPSSEDYWGEGEGLEDDDFGDSRMTSPLREGEPLTGEEAGSSDEEMMEA